MGSRCSTRKFIFTGTPDNLDIEDLNALNKKTGLPKDKTLHTIAGMTDSHWAILIEIKPNSIAEKAGLKQGDVITKVLMGKAKDLVTKNIFTGMELRIAISDAPEGEEFEIEYERIDSEGRVDKKTTKIKLP